MTDASPTLKIDRLEGECRTAKLGTRVTFAVPSDPISDCSLDAQEHPDREQQPASARA
jgi:hypothetical protein